MLEEILKSRCEAKTEYQNKFRRYESVREELSELLRVVPVYFPHFSRHDESHSRNIIESAEQLLGDMNAEILSSTDILFVLLSAYAHDVGMSLRYKVIESRLTSAEWRDKLKTILGGKQPDMKMIAEKLSDYPESVQGDEVNGSIELYREIQLVFETIFRDEHASRSAEYISAYEPVIKLLGIRLTAQLAAICRMHEKDIKEVMTLPFEENGLFGDYLHPRLIASMLCFCDLLDMDTDRFDETMLNAVSDLPKLSRAHKKKHESVKHFLIKAGNVEIKADCPDYEVYRLMRSWIDWMKKASETMVYNWDEICPHNVIAAPRIKQCEILLQENSKWCEMADVRLHIDSKRALEILKGTNIYRNKGVFIREILQNSIDASLIQLCRDMKTYLGKKQSDTLTMEEAQDYISNHNEEFREYEIKGSYLIEGGRVKVEITDRGTGIRRDDIKNIAGVKGKGEKYKEEIDTFPEMLRPAGAFGLGIQSVFLVSDRIDYYTKADGEEAKHITIEDYQDGNGYVTVSDIAEDMPRGTRTVIYFDSSRFSQTDLRVSDYAFQNRKREELLLTWLIQHCNNIDSDELAPAFKVTLQKEDYFPVKIEGYFPDEPGKTMNVISRKSMLPRMVKNRDGDVSAKFYTLTFQHTDCRQALLFEAELRIPDEAYAFGILHRNHRIKYNQSLWYRNVLVQEGLISDRFRGTDRFLDLCDFRINIMSDKANDILNIGRNKILPSFFLKMEKLIENEISLMKRSIVDYVMNGDPENIVPGLLFYAFMYSLSENYGFEKLKNKYKDSLENISVNHYFSLAGYQEKAFKALELIDKNILLASKIDCKQSGISEEILEKISRTDMDVQMVCQRKNKEAHIVNHYLVEDYFAKIENGYYRIYEISAYRKKVKAVKCQELLLLDNMLTIICGSIRCVDMIPGYEILFTDLRSGRTDLYRGGKEQAIEMSLEPAIKNELSYEIVNLGYVTDAKARFMGRIKDSGMYEKNVRFIENFVKNRREGDVSLVRDKYFELWSKMLDILGDEKYAEFSKRRSFEIIQTEDAARSFLRPMSSHNFYYDNFIVG